MKSLIIAEKPSVAADIAKVLGAAKVSKDHFENDNLLISSALGHIAGLSISEAENKAPLPIIPKFQITALDGCRERLSTLANLIKKSEVSQIVNCCDAGREGELIFYFLYEFIGSKKSVKRMWLQSMTREAIVTAYREQKDGQQYRGLLDAARCRVESDWLIGINGSRALASLQRKTTGESNKAAVGRVQTPTLAMIVRRDLEIKNFKPQDYFEVHGVFKLDSGTYTARWEQAEKKETGGLDSRIEDEHEAQSLLVRCIGQQPSEVRDEGKEQQSNPPKLFDLTTLQRVANSRFGFSAKKTLDLAQSLYEKHKILSYPRTDAEALPEDYAAQVVTIMAKLGEPYSRYAQVIHQSKWVNAAEKRIFDNKKISDHFAIIPTGEQLGQLNDDEAKLYDLVTRRFLAAFYPAARYFKTKRTTTLAGEEFISHGRVLKEAGWRSVYKEEDAGEENDNALCVLAAGESATVVSLESKALKTKPPAYFTEATLLAAMEGASSAIEDEEAKRALKGKGLGTPATRAATIEGLKTKGYIKAQGKQIQASESAINLISFLEQNNLKLLVSADMTGEWEFKLEQMSQGKYERYRFMQEIGRTTVELVKTFKEQEVLAKPAEGLTAPCPSCGAAMFRRASKFKAGEYYWSCSGFPQCKTNLPDVDGKPGEKKQETVDLTTTIVCEKCGKPMVRRASKFKAGEHYWSCTGFPKCKASKPCGDEK